ncbi:MAG: DUF1559 domain-containing protein [Candidatus Hydrogenedentes bacterium]|nr:DUF1559 domain-containing protein [Candidatus Hydrogenedentota bacterium]
MTPRDAKALRLLRGYLLGTLSQGDHAEVERLIAQSDEWRVALESERQAIALLDGLPHDEPPPGLAASVVAAAMEGDRAVPRALYARRQWIAVIATACVVAVIGAVALPWLSRAREAARRASNANNLKQLGIVFKMYASESRDMYPPIASYVDVWMFDLRAVYPKYLTDLSVLVNPSLPDAEEMVEQLNAFAAKEPIDWEAMTRIAARSYTYTGWMIKDPSEFTKLADARRSVGNAQLDSDIQVDGKRFVRLREGVERFLITDINDPTRTSASRSDVPILFTTSPLDNRSGLTLYMDGHVDAENFPPIVE